MLIEPDTIELYVPLEEAGTRLDRFVSRAIVDLSRSFAQQLIAEARRPG